VRVFFCLEKSYVHQPSKIATLLARTLWGEARGEGDCGQIAVAWTIRNRVLDGKDQVVVG
jgi:spore germination cell wall hydrolase CwlJ-like protein